mgnify:CR=1 FL=1
MHPIHTSAARRAMGLARSLLFALMAFSQLAPPSHTARTLATLKSNTPMPYQRHPAQKTVQCTSGRYATQVANPIASSAPARLRRPVSRSTKA